MAIKDISKKPYINDNDDTIYIGIDLPFRKSTGEQGYFASTSTTIEAVKNNIRNLLNTYEGERLMQPILGINLRQYLFNQITEETVISIQNDILDKFKFWLPFVEVRDIKVSSKDEDMNVGVNSLVIEILFNIKKDPLTLASVQINVTSDQINDNIVNTNLNGY